MSPPGEYTVPHYESKYTTADAACALLWAKDYAVTMELASLSTTGYSK